MGKAQFFKAGIAGVLFSSMLVLGPMPASAANMWWQQAILLVHVPIGGGQFFTTNYTITANEGANTTVNVKCFNDSLQRIGPAGGVNVVLSATGQLAQHTPTTLQVTTDPLFQGIGWCWANNINSGLDYNVETLVGGTSSLAPGGLLSSPDTFLLTANTGLAQKSSSIGGIPFFTTVGGVQNWAFILNPLTTPRTLTLQLFDANGIAQGPSLVRPISGRGLAVLSIPGVFGLPTPPTTGSLKITIDADGFLGWAFRLDRVGNLIFTAIGLDGDNVTFLSPGSAP